MKPIEHISIPEFSEFIVTPNNPACDIIDSTRIMVEILWWLSHAWDEIEGSTFSNRLILDGQYALVVRYKREKDGQYRPACTLSFDVHENGVRIQQIQWSKDKKVGFRFNSSFHTSGFLLRIIEESFIKKWIPVTVEQFPKWLENAAYGSRAMSRYDSFRAGVEWLQRKYEQRRLEQEQLKVA
jgi:hypothetical protein